MGPPALAMAGMSGSSGSSQGEADRGENSQPWDSSFAECEKSGLSNVSGTRAFKPRIPVEALESQDVE